MSDPIKYIRTDTPLTEEWDKSYYVGTFSAEKIETAQSLIEEKRLHVELICSSTGLRSGTYHVGLREHQGGSAVPSLPQVLHVYHYLVGSLTLDAALTLGPWAQCGTVMSPEVRQAALQALDDGLRKICEVKEIIANARVREW
jgi:hypothetical protein